MCFTKPACNGNPAGRDGDGRRLTPRTNARISLVSITENERAKRVVTQYPSSVPSRGDCIGIDSTPLLFGRRLQSPRTADCSNGEIGSVRLDDRFAIGLEYVCSQSFRDNTYIDAEISYRDGRKHIWSFPQMQELGYAERYVKQRHRKFATENLWVKENSAIGPMPRATSRV